MSEAKTYKAGVADEVWKVLIAARDHTRASDLLREVSHIVAGPTTSTDEAATALRGFTGDQIVGALLAYRENAFQMIANGLKAGAQE